MGMKLSCGLATVALFTVSACATYETENASNKEVIVAVQSETTPDTYGRQAASEEEGNRIICKRQVVTGSRFSKNVCMTWAEWKQREENSKEYVKNTQRRATQQGNPQGG